MSPLCLKPQIAALQLATNNPTLTTVALEKPSCMFDSSLHPNKSCAIYLYAMKELVDKSANSQKSLKFPLMFLQTSGGQLGPYKAAAFNTPNCALPPKLTDIRDVNKVSDILKQYLFRVGDDGTCLYDPNFLAVCNAPLAFSPQFKYVLVDSTEGIMKDQNLWSDPIKTKRVKLPLKIDIWSGQKSGGMIVITSILSVLMFLLLAGLLASVSSAVM
uniref:Uroplakin 3A n=1 Tax=Calidris pygmaea TaxID=425635 RepID=A0A8C3PNY4_9CHAR